MNKNSLGHLGGLPLAVIVAACGETSTLHGTLPQVAVTVFGDHRFFEARLSPFVNHEKCVDTSDRGFACSPLSKLNRDARFAERRWWREIEAGVAEVESSKRAEALHASGLRLLIWTRNGSGDSKVAIDKLEAAARASPTDAAIFSDLAAAYLIHASFAPSPEVFLQAVAAAHRAVDLAPENPACLFNLALSLEKLPARAAASRVWKTYLVWESNADWSREAESRIEALQQAGYGGERPSVDDFLAAVDGDPDEFGAWIQENAPLVHDRLELGLLPAWAARKLTGLGDRTLEALQALATVYGELSGDLRPVESIRWASGIEAEAVLPAFEDLSAGISALYRAKPDVADRKLASANEVFERYNSPLAAWASYHLILCSFQRAKYDQALENIAQLRSTLEEDHPHLRAHLAKVEGLIRFFQGSWEAAARSFEEALEGFESVREGHEIEAAHSNLGRVYSELGLYDRAWKHARAALRQVSDTTCRAKNRCDVFSDAAELALRLGETGVALLLQEEAVLAAEETGRSMLIAPARRRRAEMFLRAGLPERARRDVEAARASMSQVDSADWRWHAEADLDLVAGEIESEIDPARALVRLDRARAGLAATRFDLRLPRAHLARARAFSRLDRPAEAAEAIEEAIGALESQRARIGDEGQRTAFLDQQRQVYDLAVRLHHELGDPAMAFAYAEAARSRVLAEALGGSDGGAEWAPAGPDREWAARMRAALPPSTTLIHFTQLSDRLLAWVLSAIGFAAVEIGVGSETLRHRADDLLEGLLPTAASGAAERAAERLFSLLSPAFSRVEPGHDLVIVPDGALYRVPFAALRDPVTGRFLIEDHVVSVAPSARVHRSLTAHLSGRSWSGSWGLSALVVAADAGAGDQARLTRAAQEAREVAELHNGRVLQGRAATPSRLLETVPGYGLLHVVSHAQAAARRGQRSHLLLASENGNDGKLTAQQIAKADLSRTRLVVLAACETAGGLLSPTEGVASLARAFLAAGVPGVIATHWPVKDVTTESFSVALHRRLAAGEEPARALRDTQIEFLRSTESEYRQPRVWGAFQFFGAARSAEKGDLD